jgi:hypothetical protein
MGGSGSGNHYHWWRRGKKATVESCRSFDVNRWMRERILRPGVFHCGSWHWTDARTGEERASIGYEVNTLDLDAAWVRLTYTATQKMDYRIRLRTTRPYFGGLRWWLVCPLVVNGVPCGRRVGKLYLRGRYFGCRHCLNLTYTSSQESHQHEALYRLMAGNMGWDVATVRDVMKRIGKRGLGD